MRFRRYSKRRPHRLHADRGGLLDLARVDRSQRRLAVMPRRRCIYTASDFPSLAQGVDPGLAGEATVQVWAPRGNEWRLTAADGTLTLHHQIGPGDPVPRWQTLGKVSLAKGRPLKVVVSDEPPKSDRLGSAIKPAQEDRAKKTASRKPKRPLARSRLAVAFDHRRSETADRALDLIRGRIDTIEPTPDYRRNQVRTNDQGADFQAPATAAAWRDRAAASPRADAESHWDSGRCFPRRRSIPRSTASSIATITRSRKSCSRPFPASRSAATSTGRPSEAARCRGSCARTGTGRTAA